jgi:hypothetical protein
VFLICVPSTPASDPILGESRRQTYSHTLQTEPHLSTGATFVEERLIRNSYVSICVLFTTLLAQGWWRRGIETRASQNKKKIRYTENTLNREYLLSTGAMCMEE